MDKESVKNWLLSRGWKEHRKDILIKKTIPVSRFEHGDMRICLRPRVIRFEVASINNCPLSGRQLYWHRVRSGHYGKLSISENNKLKGLTR